MTNYLLTLVAALALVAATDAYADVGEGDEDKLLYDFLLQKRMLSLEDSCGTSCETHAPTPHPTFPPTKANTVCRLSLYSEDDYPTNAHPSNLFQVDFEVTSDFSTSAVMQIPLSHSVHGNVNSFKLQTIHLDESWNRCYVEFFDEDNCSPCFPMSANVPCPLSPCEARFATQESDFNNDKTTFFGHDVAWTYGKEMEVRNSKMSAVSGFANIKQFRVCFDWGFGCEI